MKEVTSKPAQERVTDNSNSHTLSSLKSLSTAGLLLLAGCSSKDSSKTPLDAGHSPSQAPSGELVVPKLPEEPKARQQPLSERLSKTQARFGASPSDVMLKEALNWHRRNLGYEMSDSQSIEMHLGKLRPGYASSEEGKKEQRDIIEIIARHAFMTNEAVLGHIERWHKQELATLGLRSTIDRLDTYLGDKEYRTTRLRIEERIDSARQAIEAAHKSAQLEKIDFSLSSFRELQGLMEAQQRGLPHDTARLKRLSKSCDTHDLEEARWKISSLEKWRDRKLKALQKRLADVEPTIPQAIQDIAKHDERMNQKWCSNYDSMTACLEQRDKAESELREWQSKDQTGTITEAGQLIDSYHHADFKVALAAYKVGDMGLSVYTLRDNTGELAATVCEEYKGYDNSQKSGVVFVGIDKPNTTVFVKTDEKGCFIEASGGTAFQSKTLDLKATARTILERRFSPSYQEEAPTSSIPLLQEKYRISLTMNPGAVFDLSECKNGPKISATSNGSGIIAVGAHAADQKRITVEVAETLKGEAPLMIAIPENVQVEDVNLALNSDGGHTLQAGNTEFAIPRPSADGTGVNVDVEFNRQGRRFVIPYIRDGKAKMLLSRLNP